MKTFSIREVFKQAWAIFVEHVWVLVGATSIVGVVSWILQVWSSRIESSVRAGAFSQSLIFIALYAVTSLVSMTVQIGYTKMLMKLHAKEDIAPQDIFKYIDRLWYFLVGSLLYGLIVFGGVLLLVVPGIIWAITYGFASYFIIDKKMHPWKAFKASKNITQGVRLEILRFGVVVIALNILGALLFGVGFFVTLPLTTLASIIVFRILCGRTPVEQKTLPFDAEKTLQ